MKSQLKWILISMVTAFGTTAAMAGQNSENILSELLKSSIHRMVVDVQMTPDPVMKRKVIGNYLTGMDQGLEKLKANSAITASDRQAIAGLAQRYHANVAVFYALNGNPTVSDSELDSFAGFIQQQSEQAEPSWNGGVFLSTGALLILILLLIIFH